MWITQKGKKKPKKKKPTAVNDVRGWRGRCRVCLIFCRFFFFCKLRARTLFFERKLQLFKTGRLPRNIFESSIHVAHARIVYMNVHNNYYSRTRAFVRIVCDRGFYHFIVGSEKRANGCVRRQHNNNDPIATRVGG